MPVAPRSSRSIPTLVAIGLCATTFVSACDSDGGTEGLTGPGENVARGASIFAIDDQNRLVAFGRQNPTVAATVLNVTGLQGGETIVGIDFRANAAATADRRLYALTTASRLYTVDTTSGAATAVAATPFTPALAGASFGFDFNPQADRLRLHSDQDQDLRLNQLTGTVAAIDTVLTYTAGDVNAGQNPAIVATAYTNSVAGATATDLFAIDSDRDVLVFLASPNSGRLATRGALGVNTTSAAGFDIVGPGVLASFAGTAYATLTTAGQNRSRLYTVNLISGAATLVGDVNHSRPLLGIAVTP